MKKIKGIPLCDIVGTLGLILISIGIGGLSNLYGALIALGGCCILSAGILENRG